MKFVWETIILTLAGIILLRFSGRNSFSQMSITSTIVIISIGTVIVQPVIQKNVWNTILDIAIICAVLILVEYLQMKFNFLEFIFLGKPKIVIQDGQPVIKNLRKLRFSIDQLEMRLRQNGINSIKDVKTATLEANGHLGYELMPDAQALTVGEFKKLLGHLINWRNDGGQQPNLFEEIKKPDSSKPKNGEI